MSYILVAVPVELVPEVTELLERRQPDQANGAKGPGGSLLHGWNEQTVRRAYRESGDNMRNILRFLARNGGREVSADEIAAAIGARFGWNSVAGMLGAFGRRSTNRYGRSFPMWEQRYDDLDRVRILMPKDIAEAIKKAEDEK
jgi:hypothetical protein